MTTTFPAFPTTIALEAEQGFHACTHFFDKETELAIKAALVTGRPLLIRGEPGIGKTQVARAAAAVLGRPLVARTLDAQTEISDLFWEYDALRRLAEAQLAPARVSGGETSEVATARLAMSNFTRPGALWWALDWAGASNLPNAVAPAQPEGWESTASGVVLLLDEIDKVDSAVPNGLLDAITRGDFRGPDGACHTMTSPRPLIVITSNEERPLPDAFVRRCLVLSLALPKGADAATDWLRPRVEGHPALAGIDGEVFGEGVKLLLEERGSAGLRNMRRPSLAELIDLLVAVTTLYPADTHTVDERVAALKSLKALTLSKPLPDTLP